MFDLLKKKSSKFWYSLSRQLVFFDWIDRDFMSERISWFHFAGLVHCSLYVLCCSQSFLVICFWVILAKGCKCAEIPLEILSGVLLVSPFGSKHGYLGTYNPTCNYTSKQKNCSCYLLIGTNAWLPRATRYRSSGRRWGRFQKHCKACQNLWLWRGWKRALQVLMLSLGHAGCSAALGCETTASELVPYFLHPSPE